ncbi:heavy metal translocating P-type ATPase [Fusobacterium massiliense]|jgi:cadmium-exporting ATPase|uniref:heavy metal translocating P-type ATPase n=1 Tax=Fusobacterium massiliense TaxID=1852365 RepID=UPI0009400745|nr:heavy metal translocating P-type ATPase [Fusobacterium massiliense]
MKKKELTLVLGAVLFSISMLLRNSNQYLQLILIIISYVIIGKNVIFKFVNNIKRGNYFDENTLMTIATLGAFMIGEYPEAVVVMLFYEVGELFQSYAIGKSRKSIAELMDIKAEYANLYKNNEIMQVEPDEVQIGDIIEIRPGEKVPLDAEIIEGETTINTSPLTGESIPLEAREGTKILSGCININGVIKAKVTKEYFDSTVNKILDLVENSVAKKSETERLMTRFAKVYTPIVVILAILLAIFPPIILGDYNFKMWIFRALAFLVVSCPCAFVLSIPLSFFSGIGAASRAGILIKGGNYLESLSKVDRIVFDKTGTLTKGIFKVQKIVLYNDKYTEEETLRLVAFAESSSNHPIAKSIVKYYNKEIDKSLIHSVKEVSGKGIEASIENKIVMIGNEKLISVPNNFLNEEIGTVLYIQIDGLFIGYILISDELKKDTKETIRDLKKIGIKKTIMLTGDRKNIANYIGNDIEIDEIYSELLPQDKVDIFEKIISKNNSKSKIAFVGDGINDAPVLARADIGIAMGAMGSDAAIEAADIVIMNDEPSKIITAIKLARKTIKIANQNMLVAFGVKVLALILSALGIADMWMAVFADVGVTIIAVLNSFRALKIDK